MKRCPQCDFIYLDSDQVCDLDGTPLVFVDDARIDALTSGISQDATHPAPAELSDSGYDRHRSAVLGVDSFTRLLRRESESSTKIAGARTGLE